MFFPNIWTLPPFQWNCYQPLINHRSYIEFNWIYVRYTNQHLLTQSLPINYYITAVGQFYFNGDRLRAIWQNRTRVFRHQIFPRVVRKFPFVLPKHLFHYRVYIAPQIVSTWSQINPKHTLPYNSFKVCINNSSIPSSHTSVRQVCPTITSIYFLSPLRTTCSANFILDFINWIIFVEQ